MMYSIKLWSEERNLLIRLLRKEKRHAIDPEEKQMFSDIISLLIHADVTNDDKNAGCDLNLIDGYNMLCENVLERSDSFLSENLLRKLIFSSSFTVTNVN